MIRDYKIKKDRFLSFYFFLMYLYTSMPAIQFSMTDISNPFFVLIGYGLTMIAAFKYRINFFNKRIFLVVLIIICWTIAQFLLHRSYFRFSPFIILEIISAYTIIKIYRTSIFKKFEDITCLLCVIALIGWILNIVLNPVMIYIAKTIGIVASGKLSSTLLLYTVNTTDGIRNCGFGWEPGRTACMVTVGILLYLMRTKFNLRKKRFWIMTLCLITTFSTTGYSIFIVILSLCYISMKRINPVVIFSITAISMITLSLPFMWEKIAGLTEQATKEGIAKISRSLDWEATNEGQGEREYYVPQRFQGLMLSVINLQNSDHLIGDGRDFTQFYINRVSNWKVKTSEGILEPIAQYGIIIAFLMYYSLYITSKRISYVYKVNNKWLYFIVFVMINISYNFWETPLFMTIWMIPIFIKSNHAKSRPAITVNSNSLLQQC
ncbi:hypothetical protein [Bacteroides acidifaciens]|uniref:hypothetical protein n=1 Tax=Bacteroides acidifaciens TaxID=85831 RepID=UPI002570C574|nr:hypothetical protein [Bacteroides acidifaciens]